MDPSSFEEWMAVIAKLPNEKAAGPSGIHNEQIKHLGPNLQHLLWKLIQICFIIGDIPLEWKIAHVYPIPKPMEWGCDITKTRLITLLETTRKAFVKIITNRLSSIIAKHKICKGNNFAGLSDGFTKDLIKIMNILIENAIKNKKDIWILLQDLSKAYDCIDLSILKLAMH